VYVAGDEHEGNNQTACYWINGVRQPLAVTKGKSGHAAAIAVSGSDVYVAGGEWDGRNYNPCYWVNGTRQALPVAFWKGGIARAIALRQ
jgi:hypothetical protein